MAETETQAQGEQTGADSAFTRSDGPGRYILSKLCRGPWDEKSLHARVLAGLLGHETEINHGGDGFHCARLTIDLYRLPPLTPCEITTKPIREGGRIRVVELEYLSEGVSYARATAVLLKRTENTTGKVWSPEPWDVPSPDAATPREGMLPSGDWKPMWETRYLSDRAPGSSERGRAWLREVRPLVEGIELTPFVRAASMADWTNPSANWGSNGLEFINADITLYLHRYPAGEWLGFEVASHHASEGIAVGECTIYDEQGAIGSGTVCAIAQRRGVR